jgi:hypothetical protein
LHPRGQPPKNQSNTEAMSLVSNQAINQSIGLDQSRQQKRTATLNDSRPNRSSNPDAG